MTAIETAKEPRHEKTVEGWIAENGTVMRIPGVLGDCDLTDEEIKEFTGKGYRWGKSSLFQSTASRCGQRTGAGRFTGLATSFTANPTFS